jgi:hypothetical protein
MVKIIQFLKYMKQYKDESKKSTHISNNIEVLGSILIY